VLHTRVGIGGWGSGAFATTALRNAADQLLVGERWENVLSGLKIPALSSPD
jgi:hypothetical protein